MDILSVKDKTDYVLKINNSKFIQNNKIKNVKENDYKNKNKYCKSIDEIIISINEPEYLLTESKDLFINKLKIKIANDIEDSNYDKYNYSKYFSKSVIQSGLQENNMISTLIYLSDYYNINIYIYHKENDVYYNYIDKNDKNIYVIFDKTGWKISDVDYDIENIEIYKMNLFLKNTFINNNLKNNIIYKSFLNPISKYKMTELVKIAEDNNVILIDKNGKKKIKQILYDDINYKYI
tara:strand:+ start:2840 stop:3547 length:708 start_codon:yes stop_codon:yes gene_type:complete